MKLSIVMPVLNEAGSIEDALRALAPLRRRSVEVVVADGGSSDATVALARPLADIVIAAPRGRGTQMNAGAAASGGEVLLFLHADTRLPPQADALIRDGFARSGCRSGRFWGRFDIRIAGAHPLFSIIAAAMNMRSRITGIATGDQAIFMSRAAFGPGFPDIALMEDIAMTKRLKRSGPPLCIAAPAVTSGRRWEKHGVMRTIVLMGWLRLAYFLGANPTWLARSYGYVPRQS